MNPPRSDSPDDPAPDGIGDDSVNLAPDSSQGAYLIVKSAGRWSDVFRLFPPAQATIGRASSNQIAIRTDQASRRHARIYWQGGDDHSGWLIEDLGSRNGTFVNGQKLSDPQWLSDGDIVEVAGFGIQFSSQIHGMATDAGNLPADSSQATDDQLTMEMDPSAITDRRRFSQYLRAGNRTSKSDSLAQRLLQLAFAIGRAEKTGQAIEQVLDGLNEVVRFNTAGVYLIATKASSTGVNSVNDLDLAGTRQSGNRSYRRPPDSLVKTVAADDGQAILARNVLGDRQLATENSRGEIDVESVILAPVRDRDRNLRGMLHLTTTAGDTPFSGDDLEFVVAAGEILAESLAVLATRKRLNRSLRRSRQQVKQLQKQIGDKVKIVGESEAMANVVEQVSLAAPTNATVLVRGESGVGKELVAAAIHHASPRRDGPLICLNCAALSPTLLESELFGHEKGAFYRRRRIASTASSRPPMAGR